jgi:hypothetical protein
VVVVPTGDSLVVGLVGLVSPQADKLIASANTDIEVVRRLFVIAVRRDSMIVKFR